MSIRADLLTYLATKTSVTAIFSTRMYSQQAPQGAGFPRLILTELGGERTGSLGGANEQIKTSFALESQSESAGIEAIAGADALANVLDYFQGTMGSSTVQGVFVMNAGDSIDPPTDASEKAIHSSTLNIDVWYEKAVPTYV